MTIKFISRVRKGNKRGTGFLAAPKEKWHLLNLNERMSVEVLNKVYFYAQIIEYSHKLGVYIPKEIAKKYRLFNKEVKVKMKKIKGFYAPVASDGRIYLPYDIIEQESLHQNDIISIKAMEDDKVVQKKYAKIYVAIRPRRRTREFICYIDKMFGGRTLLFRIKKLSSTPQNGEVNLSLVKLLSKTHYAFINKNSAVIFSGNKVPAIINANCKLSNLAFYLGAYFADGTKKGNSWAICASTFEQAKYYFKMHNYLVRDSKPEFTISFTNIHKTNKNQLKKSLAKTWKDNTGIKVDKFRIREAEGKLCGKWNPCGTLVIREHRQILLDAYNALLKLLIKEILMKKDRKIAIDFICGTMEGDGYASANPQGSVKIWANKEDVCVLRKILKVTEMKYNVVKDGENKYFLKINALEILKNFNYLRDKIFILYPKRRKRLFERLRTVGATKFLIGNHEPTSRVKVWLKDNKLCDNFYEITPKGMKLGQELVPQ